MRTSRTRPWIWNHDAWSHLEHNFRCLPPFLAVHPSGITKQRRSKLLTIYRWIQPSDLIRCECLPTCMFYRALARPARPARPASSPIPPAERDTEELLPSEYCNMERKRTPETTQDVIITRLAGARAAGGPGGRCPFAGRRPFSRATSPTGPKSPFPWPSPSGPAAPPRT